MNYRHGFHAGSFTDVVKHVCITAITLALTQKQSPFCYLDTHAGKGLYDLYSTEAQKTKEYLSGIEKIIQQDNPPDEVRLYLDCVHRVNSQYAGSKISSLHYYPGSPLLMRQLLRAEDRIIACELHAEEYQALKNTFAGDKRVAVHHTDGFQGLKAFLPPKEKRGFILIDPPYENPDEFTLIAHHLPTALKRFSNGIFAIWYPIKDKYQLDRFHRALRSNITQEILLVELTTYPDIPNHLNGCGLAIINPPFQIDKNMNKIMQWLWKALTINDQGGFRVNYLK